MPAFTAHVTVQEFFTYATQHSNAWCLGQPFSEPPHSDLRTNPCQPNSAVLHWHTIRMTHRKTPSAGRKEMRVNNVVTKMKAGEMAYGCGFSFSSPTLVELAGRAGFDFVSYDSEHGPFTIDMLDDLCRFADMAGMTPMARVPDIEHPTILRFLDRGIMGITGPPHRQWRQGATTRRRLPLCAAWSSQLRLRARRVLQRLPIRPRLHGAHQRQHPRHRAA